MIHLEVNPFRMGTDKEAALKPLEEASEVHGAWENVERYHLPTYYLADEIADCITACCNLADRYGIELQPALDRARARNEERGRYA